MSAPSSTGAAGTATDDVKAWVEDLSFFTAAAVGSTGDLTKPAAGAAATATGAGATICEVVAAAGAAGAEIGEPVGALMHFTGTSPVSGAAVTGGGARSGWGAVHAMAVACASLCCSEEGEQANIGPGPICEVNDLQSLRGAGVLPECELSEKRLVEKKTSWLVAGVTFCC